MASTKVMDALFGLAARNDAEWTRRELLDAHGVETGTCTIFEDLASPIPFRLAPARHYPKSSLHLSHPAKSTAPGKK